MLPAGGGLAQKPPVPTSPTDLREEDIGAAVQLQGGAPARSPAAAISITALYSIGHRLQRYRLSDVTSCCFANFAVVGAHNVVVHRPIR